MVSTEICANPKHRDFGLRNDKNIFFIRPEITIRPTAKLSFEFILQRLHEKHPDGTAWELSEWTRRFVVNYQFAQRMYARTSAEFTLEKERRVFALFAYEYRPESNLFIVYNDNRNVEGDTERIVFIKVSHLLENRSFLIFLIIRKALNEVICSLKVSS